MTNETVVPSQIRSSLEVFEELGDSIEVIGLGQLGDGEREDDAVEVNLRGEGGGAADFEDLFGVGFRFQKRKGGACLFHAGQGGLAAGGEDR